MQECLEDAAFATNHGSQQLGKAGVTDIGDKHEQRRPDTLRPAGPGSSVGQHGLPQKLG